MSVVLDENLVIEHILEYDVLPFSTKKVWESALELGVIEIEFDGDEIRLDRDSGTVDIPITINFVVSHKGRYKTASKKTVIKDVYAERYFLDNDTGREVKDDIENDLENLYSEFPDDEQYLDDINVTLYTGSKADALFKEYNVFIKGEPEHADDNVDFLFGKDIADFLVEVERRASKNTQLGDKFNKLDSRLRKVISAAKLNGADFKEVRVGATNVYYQEFAALEMPILITPIACFVRINGTPIVLYDLRKHSLKEAQKQVERFFNSPPVLRGVNAGAKKDKYFSDYRFVVEHLSLRKKLDVNQ